MVVPKPKRRAEPTHHTHSARHRQEASHKTSNREKYNGDLSLCVGSQKRASAFPCKRPKKCNMGLCQSGVDQARDVDLPEGERCPTVFELERTVEKKRGASKRLHPNLVNIEFRRGLFEMYHKGDRIKTRSESTKMFVATHKVRMPVFVLWGE